ncbi:hypothetical protein K402DRAFT_463084 [Aulographum hederae CBS 113979]|uniref:Nephrocystin 3-like N-terminal domain-containing protein n=1 Tax=Aulographum hederae CBS 113979 TaxID=1176131 RepID=A0A6G1H152_9PEZI|nr:hypothetical protein K402DRAFT_463084 [Aulographum hederae CBS 113979]
MCQGHVDQLVLLEDQYLSWTRNEQSLLWLCGGPGLGKTSLSHAIISDLKDRFLGHRRTAVAFFYFREEHDNLKSFRDALGCAAVQIAEQDATYCEQLSAELACGSDDDWTQCFADRYPSKSDAHLYLVLDGIDEANEEDTKAMTQLFRGIESQQMNIHICFTSRPTLKPLIPECNIITIEITKEHVASDMKLLIAARLRIMPRLHKFRRQTQRKIEEKLHDKADSMLYIEHMLRRLGAIGREKAVLRDIEKNMPDTLENLYALMLEECQKGRTHEQYLTLKKLFAWLAFSARPLTLEGASDLVKLTISEDEFDIDEEIFGRSARILEIRRGCEEDGQVDDDDDDVEEEAFGRDSNSEGKDTTDEGTNAPLTFQERSLRNYFRAVSVEENGLRTPPSTGHLEIFETIVTLLCAEEENGKSEKEKPRLRNNAANLWASHFIEIKLNQVSDEQVVAVLKGVIGIITNTNDVAGCFVKHDAPVYTSLNEDTGFVAKLQEWVDHVKQLEKVQLDQETKAWVDSVLDARKCMLPLARGHVLNWFKASSYHEAANIYVYAIYALMVAGEIDPGPEGVWASPQKNVEKVFNVFPDIKRSARTYSAVGEIFWWVDELDIALKYGEKSMATADKGPLDSFFNLFLLSRVKFDLAEKVGWEPSPKRGEGDGASSTWKQTGDGADQGTELGGGCAQDDGNEETVQETQCKTHHGNKEMSIPVEIQTEKTEVNQPGTPVKYGRDWMQEGICDMNTAISTLPSNWKEDKSLVTNMEDVLERRGLSENRLGRSDDAINSINESRSLRADVTNLSFFAIDSFAHFKNWDEDPIGSIELIKTLTTKERTTWFDWLYSWSDFEALHKLAKLAGDEGIQTLRQWHENYINAIRPRSAKLLAPRAALAEFHSVVLGNDETAITLLTDALNASYKTSIDPDSLNERFQSMRLRLADLLFTRFRASTKPSEKVACLDKLKGIPNPFRRNEQSLSLEFGHSNIEIMQAIMTRTVGSAIEYHTILEKCFSTCVAGLEDSIGWNDNDSLRLLAKVLACVGGLERDAAIALTLQFYMCDPDNYKNEDEVEGDVQEGMKAVEKEAEKEIHKDEEKVPIDVKTEEYAGEVEARKVVGEFVRNKEVIVTTIVTALKDSTLDSITTTIQESSTAVLPEQIAGTDQGAAHIEPTQEQTTEYDLSGLYISCDGKCGTDAINSWTQPYYMCIICGITDLCESWYQERLRMNKGHGCSYWRSWCGQDHM